MGVLVKIVVLAVSASAYGGQMNNPIENGNVEVKKSGKRIFRGTLKKQISTGRMC